MLLFNVSKYFTLSATYWSDGNMTITASPALDFNKRAASAMAGAVVAGRKAGGYDTFDQARKAMTGVKAVTYKPNAANVKIYRELYKLYRQMHDAFGVAGNKAVLANVMKDLLKIKEAANA